MYLGPMRSLRFLIPLLTLLGSLDAQSPTEDGPRFPSQEIAIEHRLESPYVLTSESGVDLSLQNRISAISYRYRGYAARSLLASISFVEETISYADSVVDIQLLTPLEIEFDFQYSHPMPRLTPTVAATFNQDFSSYLLSGFLDWSFWKFDIEWGVVRLKDFLDPCIDRQDDGYLIEIFKSDHLFHQSYEAQFGKLNLEFSNELSWHRIPPIKPVKKMGLTLSPYRNSSSIRVGYQLSSDKLITLDVDIHTDTLNTELYERERVIGNLYAFDSDRRHVLLALTTANLSVGYAFHSVKGSLNGSLLASPFGSWLTQLSGARFYLKSAAQLDYHAFNLTWEPKTSSVFSLGIKNHLLVGTGDLQYRSYVWQLFNPISNLNLRQLQLNRYILDVIQIHIGGPITGNLSFQGSVKQLIPLYLKYSLTGDEFAAESVDTDITLGTDIGIKLIYSF